MFYWKKSGNIWKGCNLTPRAAHKYFQRECKNHQGEVTSAPHAYFSWLTKPLLQHKPLGLWLTTTWHISQADLFFPCPSCPSRLKKYSLPPLPEKILLNQDKFPHSPFFFLFSSTCCKAFLPNSWILLQVPASCLWQSSWPASGSFQPHSKDAHWAWTTKQVPFCPAGDSRCSLADHHIPMAADVHRGYLLPVPSQQLLSTCWED